MCLCVLRINGLIVDTIMTHMGGHMVRQEAREQGGFSHWAQPPTGSITLNIATLGPSS